MLTVLEGLPGTPGLHPGASRWNEFRAHQDWLLHEGGSVSVLIADFPAPGKYELAFGQCFISIFWENGYI